MLRLIPAGAGHMDGAPYLVGGEGAHPRWRGAHAAMTLDVYADLGSSPLARGTFKKIFPARRGIRLIPAGAGHICWCCPHQV